MQPELVRFDPFGDRQESQVQLVDPQQLGALLAGLLTDRQRDSGYSAWNSRAPATVDRSHRVDRADVTWPRSIPRNASSSAEPTPTRPGSARADDQRLAGLGQAHMARGALDQRHPDLVLELADLLRQRRLGDVLGRRRAREVQFLGQRNEVAQLSSSIAIAYISDANTVLDFLRGRCHHQSAVPLLPSAPLIGLISRRFGGALV